MLVDFIELIVQLPSMTRDEAFRMLERKPSEEIMKIKRIEWLGNQSLAMRWESM